jgi:hypothetical protein
MIVEVAGTLLFCFTTDLGWIYLSLHRHYLCDVLFSCNILLL